MEVDDQDLQGQGWCQGYGHQEGCLPAEGDRRRSSELQGLEEDLQIQGQVSWRPSRATLTQRFGSGRVYSAQAFCPARPNQQSTFRMYI